MAKITCKSCSYKQHNYYNPTHTTQHSNCKKITNIVWSERKTP